MAQVEGEIFGSRWNCVLDYSTSSTATTYTVSGSCIFRSRGYAMRLNGFYVHVDINDNTNSSESGSMNCSSAWVDKVEISHSRTFTKTHSSQSIYINACIDRRDASYYPGKSIPTAYLTIPAKDSYTVSYNANGGSGAPSSQTKWYGEDLTLLSTKPTRSDYTFVGWATSASATSPTYSAGGTYTANAGVTLYAVWSQNPTKATIAYNANGGSGAPSSQAHTQYTTSTISSTKPTRANYTFLGWSTSSTATTATYLAGGRYTNNSLSSGSTVVLYAVWKKNYAPIYINVGSVPSGKSLKGVYYNA